MFNPCTTPETAYRQSAVDARIKGAKPEELVSLCLEEVIVSLSAALRAHEAGDMTRCSSGLTRAHSALIALEMGVDRDAQMAKALLQLYGAARETILASVSNFDVAKLTLIRNDFREIVANLSPSRSRL